MTGQAKSPPQDWIIMGRIGAAHGIRGEVRLQSFCEKPGDILNFSPLKTQSEQGEIHLTSVRPANNVLIARIKGVNSRNDAEKLNAVELFIERSRLPEAPDDEFYHSDLIGLDVVLADGASFGTVASVQNFGAGDMLEIRDADGKTEYYPFTRQTVSAIDLKSGWLTFAPPAEIAVKDEADIRADDQ